MGEASRLVNISRNGALLENLGVNQQAKMIRDESKVAEPAKKKRRVEKSNWKPAPSRVSARIASAPTKPVYDEDGLTRSVVAVKKSRSKPSKGRQSVKVEEEEEPESAVPVEDINTLQESWTSWEPVAVPPLRDEAGVFHFESHPDFTPNKSPEELLPEWIEGLNVDLFLTSHDYDPDINKFKVACGQSIEEWELAGWINHKYDVRGWFQWYCRFFMGRRCEDDD